jgi:hypothetical protein
MERRKTVQRVRPAQPEQTVDVQVREFTCDRCGVLMPEHNASGGYLPPLEGTAPRNKLSVVLDREQFTGERDGQQHLSRDYCDDCLPGIWKDITEILAYGSADGQARET